MNWQHGKKWSDRFLPEIKRHLGEFLIGEPAIEEDQQHNTDLLVLKLDPVRVACRVRRFSAFAKPKWRNEFTIRSRYANGAKTELHKIMEGWGDYLFYGFANEKETRLCAWRLLSLNDFRLWFNRQLVRCDRGQMPGREFENTDRITYLRAFDATLIPGIIRREDGFDLFPDYDVSPFTESKDSAVTQQQEFSLPF